MSATLISLLAVTIGFGGLVLWVYWPSNKEELESLGSMPLEDVSEDRDAKRIDSTDRQTEERSNS
jgi:cbb3-type cytochrome oxidase subunit 3